MLTVALYGQSLALSSVGANLATHEWLCIAPLRPDGADLAQSLAAVDAHVVIFDLAGPHPDAFALWKTRPDLLLIGVDLGADTALVLSRTSTHVTTRHELLEVIRSGTPVERKS